MRCADTNFLIDLLAGEPDVKKLVAELDANREYFTTSINVFELLAGAYQMGKNKLDAAKLLISRFQIFEFDWFAADEAARIYSECRKKGTEIPMRDAMVAGIVRANGCTLLTRDLKHFRRVRKLEVVGW